MKRLVIYDIIFDGSLCLFCGHFAIKAIHLNDQLKGLCMAFPEDIPGEIADGKFDHRKPHPDVKGILF